MGRLVKSKNRDIAARGVEKNNDPAPQDYFERVGKYIPGEIIAGYVAMLSFLNSSEESWYLGLSIGIFVLCLILTPFYFKMMAKGEDNLKNVRLHQLVSTVAFVVWAYAIGSDNGLFGTLGWYNASLGSILLVAFTLVSGVIEPKG